MLNAPHSQSHRDSGPGLAEISAITEHIPGATLVVDVSSGIILSANQQMAGLAGRTASEMAGLALETIFPTFDERNVFGERLNVRLVRPNGEQVSAQVSQKLLPPLGCWALMNVVTRQDSDDQATLAKQLYTLLSTPRPSDLDESIQQSMQIAAWACAANAVAFYQADANQPYLQLNCIIGDIGPLPPKISLREFTNLQSAYLWTPHERPLISLHRAARAAGLTFVANAPIGEPNASIGLVVVTGIQAQPPSLTLAAVQVLARYLTAHIQTYQQVQHNAQQIEVQRKQLARHSLIYDALRDGVIYVSPTQQIEEMNAYAEQILGYASREVRGQPVENVLIGNFALAQALKQTRNLGYAHEIDDASLYRRDGNAFRAGLRILPLHLDDELTGWAIMLQDLSQEEQSRIRIQQLEQRALLGEVTAIFAHEVRNPINNISTGLQLMAMNLPPDAAEQESLNRMQQDCDRLSELMKSVLAFARPQEYKLEALSVEPFLRRLLERWHPRLARANITYTLHCDPSASLVQVDTRALEQVFTNLIHNAVQAMSETGGKLTLRVRQSFTEDGKQYVEISLADTGPGIPDDVREHIFEPFFTTKTGGTGLGLAITKQIVTAHRGLISVTSIPGGTAFQVLLPADKLTNH